MTTDGAKTALPLLFLCSQPCCSFFPGTVGEPGFGSMAAWYSASDRPPRYHAHPPSNTPSLAPVGAPALAAYHVPVIGLGCDFHVEDVTVFAAALVQVVRFSSLETLGYHQAGIANEL